ncbi:hypothetical protein [Kitasatospora sp. NPDC056184]|uniref:hypothetical protein n=1 Tax=Kitasatospora sp. NPDC056184 TaxID=3345738 RepID=UPI0035E28B03
MSRPPSLSWSLQRSNRSSLTPLGCALSDRQADYAPLSIFTEPYDSNGYYLLVLAPEPGNKDADSWEIEICRWEPDDPDDEECGSATGQPLIRCELPASPTAARLADLLDTVERQADLLAEWAESPVGATLDGTDLVVTRGRDN